MLFAMRHTICLLVLLVSVSFPFAAWGDVVVDVDGRRTTIRVSPGYDSGVPTPLVIYLHGRGGSGSQEVDLGLGALARAEGFLFASPDGTFNSNG